MSLIKIKKIVRARQHHNLAKRMDYESVINDSTTNQHHHFRLRQEDTKIDGGLTSALGHTHTDAAQRRHTQLQSMMGQNDGNLDPALRTGLALPQAKPIASVKSSQDKENNLQYSIPSRKASQGKTTTSRKRRYSHSQGRAEKPRQSRNKSLVDLQTQIVSRKKRRHSFDIPSQVVLRQSGAEVVSSDWNETTGGLTRTKPSSSSSPSIPVTRNTTKTPQTLSKDPSNKLISIQLPKSQHRKTRRKQQAEATSPSVAEFLKQSLPKQNGKADRKYEYDYEYLSSTIAKTTEEKTALLSSSSPSSQEDKAKLHHRMATSDRMQHDTSRHIMDRDSHSNVHPRGSLKETSWSSSSSSSSNDDDNDDIACLDDDSSYLFMKGGLIKASRTNSLHFPRIATQSTMESMQELKTHSMKKAFKKPSSSSHRKRCLTFGSPSSSVGTKWNSRGRPKRYKRRYSSCQLVIIVIWFLLTWKTTTSSLGVIPWLNGLSRNDAMLANTGRMVPFITIKHRGLRPASTLSNVFDGIDSLNGSDSNRNSSINSIGTQNSLTVWQWGRSYLSNWHDH